MARVPLAVPANQEREDAILSLLPLVHKIAKFLSFKMRKELGDLLGDGYLGAIHAVDNYDAARGVKLTSYAVPVIYGTILKGTSARSTWPERAARVLRRADKATVSLDTALGRPATEAEIEEAVPGYRKARRKAYLWSIASIETILSDGHDVAYPGRRIEAKDEARFLREAVAQLAPRQRDAIAGHYFEGKSLRQIGIEQHVTDQAVQQAHKRGLARLRQIVSSALSVDCSDGKRRRSTERLARPAKEG